MIHQNDATILSTEIIYQEKIYKDGLPKWYNLLR